MGKRGPKPLPTNVKLMRGTYRPGREVSNEPKPEPRLPSRPSWLGKKVPWGREAIREWDRVAPILERHQLLTDLDRTNLAAYCDAFARWWHWRREIARHGPNQITESGYVAQRPEIAYMNKAIDDLRKFSALFGLSPADRTRISAPEKDDEKPGNAFDRFGKSAP